MNNFYILAFIFCCLGFSDLSYSGVAASQKHTHVVKKDDQLCSRDISVMSLERDVSSLVHFSGSRPLAFQWVGRYLVVLGAEYVAVSDGFQHDHLWKYKFDSEMTGYRGYILAHGKDRIVVSIGDKFIYCFDIHSGKVVWKREFSHYVRGGMAIEGDSVFFVSADNKLYSINAQDGSVLWISGMPASMIQRIKDPVLYVADGVVVGMVSPNRLVAVDSTDGHVLWYVDVNKRSVAIPQMNPVFMGDSVYVVASDGSIDRLDIKTGRLLVSGKESAAFDSIASCPSCIRGKGAILLGSRAGISVLDCDLNKVRQISFASCSFSSQDIFGPVFVSGYGVSISANGKYILFNSRDWQIISCGKLPVTAVGRPTVFNGNLYLHNSSARSVEKINITVKRKG